MVAIGRSRRRLAMVLGAGALAVALMAGPATGSTAAAQKPVKGGTFTYLVALMSHTTWDPGLARTQTGPANDGAYWGAIYGMLVYEDYETDKVVPYMARSLTATDASTWTLKLREGVKFTDDTPYDAEAVKYNWERIANPATRSPNMTLAQQISTMTVVDPLTLKITLKTPSSYFDRTIAEGLAYIGSPTALRANAAGFRTAPVGAGPFVLKSHTDMQGAEMDRNPKYWDQPRPYLDKLIFKEIADNSQRDNTFVSSDASLERTNSQATVVQRAKNAGESLVVTPVQGATVSYIFNTATAPFNDKIARQAVIYGVNAKGFNNTLSPGLDATMTNLFEKSSVWYDQAAGKLPAYNLKKAQDLADQYRTKTGQPIAFTILAGASGEADARLQYLQTALAQVKNMEVKIETTAGGFLPNFLVPGRFQMAYSPIAIGDPGPQLDNFFSSTGPTNYGKYNNPQVDAALAEGRNAINQAARTKAYAKVQRLLIDDAAALFLSRIPDYQVAKKNVRGLVQHVWGSTLFHEAWLAKT